MISLERLLKLTNLLVLKIGENLQGLSIRVENYFDFYGGVDILIHFGILRQSHDSVSRDDSVEFLIKQLFIKVIDPHLILKWIKISNFRNARTPYIYFSVKVNQYQKRNHIPLRRKVSGLDLILSGKKPKMRFVIISK